MWTPGSSIKISNSSVYEYTHKANQLRVLLCPIAGSSVCAYMRAINAGSKDEDATVPSGAAHFIEHMSFRIQNGKIWSLASKGDVINAETNLDSTRFYVVHLPQQTEETIQIDAARFGEHAVPADKVAVERHAVMNELERGEQAGNKMFRTTSSVAILEHPYHGSTIGTRSDVEQTKAIDMEHFRTKFYVPNNTTLIFCGAFEPSAVLKAVDTHFGQMPMGNDCKPVHSPEPTQLGQRSVNLQVNAPCPMLCMAFHQPKGSTKESLIMQLISRLTWNNKEGRAKPLITNNILHDISTYAPRQLEPYLWFFHGTMEKNDPRIEQHMLGVLQTFATVPVTSSDLINVKKSMDDEWNRSTESVTDIMNELGRSVSIGRWTDFADRKAAMDTITSQDIMRVASAVFTPQNMTVTRVIPTKNQTQPLVTHELTQGTEAAPPVSQLVLETTDKDWKMVSMSPATHVLHVPRANYVRATLSARFSPAQHDLASLYVASLGNGTASNGETTTSRLMALHTERNFTHDHEFVHMTMAMPTSPDMLKEASRIMFDTDWLHPSFDEEYVELQKRHMVQEMSSLHTDQLFQVKSHFIQSLFEQTMYHTPLNTRIRRIQACTTQDLKAFHQKWLVNNNTYVTMVTPTVEAASAMGEIFPRHEQVPDTTLSWVAHKREHSETNIMLKGYGSFQIMMGQTVPLKTGDKDVVALECAAEILGGGMTGRLMHTVREQKGLGTYGLYALMQTVTPTTDQIFCVQGTFSPSSIKEGMACTKQLVQDWHAHGVTPLELNNAKDRMVGSRVIAADTVDNLHSMAIKSILEQKEPKQELELFKEKVGALTLEGVNRAIRKYIDPTALAIVVVGPESMQ